jgi:hypothetical protein
MAVFGFKGCQAGVEQFSPRHDDDVVAWRDLVTTEDLSNQSFSSISLNRAAEFPARRYSQPVRRPFTLEKENGQIPPMNPSAALVNLLKFTATADMLLRSEAGSSHSELTVRRLRPLSRRRLRTRRPFFVLIRTRKPWVRLRCRVFGWNVRLPFIFCSGALPPASLRSQSLRCESRIENVSEGVQKVSMHRALC